jgi:hypothetical protein
MGKKKAKKRQQKFETDLASQNALGVSHSREVQGSQSDSQRIDTYQYYGAQNELGSLVQKNATFGTKSFSMETSTFDLAQSAPSSREPAAVVEPDRLPDSTSIEKLLPKLILFPSDKRKPGAIQRRSLDKCVRLCEDILALRSEVKYVADLSVFAGTKVANPQLNSLLKLVEENAGPVAKMDPTGRILHERRIELCHDFEGGIPRDLQEWIALWDRKIDEEVGADYLRWLARGGAFVQKQAREWAEATSLYQPAVLGVFGRIRALRWSSRMRNTVRKIGRMQREIEHRKKRFTTEHERTAGMCGVLAAFLKAPALNAGANTRVVRKLLVLDLERELGAKLEADIAEHDARLAARRAALQARADKLKTLRAYIAHLEARKNLKLVELYAATGANVKEALPAATIRQVNEAFEETNKLAQEWKTKAENELARVHKLRRELERLAGVLDEYTERYFGSEFRVTAGALGQGASGAPENSRRAPDGPA